MLFTVNHSKSAVSLEAFWKDRLFTYSQAGKSIAIFAWDPKSPLVSLVLRDPRISPKGSVSVEAKCSNMSPIGIDLRCESQASYCSIFPVRFICNRQPGSVLISVTVVPIHENETDGMKPGFVTITAAPDVGEDTSLHVPCCGSGDVYKRQILLSAQGRPLTQGLARELAQAERVVLVCGRYEGVDERINELYCDMEPVSYTHLRCV